MEVEKVWLGFYLEKYNITYEDNLICLREFKS